MKNDDLYLKHIAKAIETINEYLGENNFEQFKENKMMVDAAIRELAIIGEAANNLSDDFKNSNPQIPFRDMIDMRNFVIHEYFGVNIKTVWDTCKTDLPDLYKVIKKQLEDK